MTAQPTNLVPGGTGRQGFLVVATNVGGAKTNGVVVVTDMLPPGLSPATQEEECGTLGQRVTCSFSKEAVPPGESIVIFIPVNVEGSSGAASRNVTTIEGGGIEGAELVTETKIGAPPPQYGFLSGPSGLGGLLSDSEGTPITRAGATPYELVVDLGFPTEMIGSNLFSAGQPRDATVDLPPGISLDPAAAPSCHEDQLERDSCPHASQVGLVGLSVTQPALTFKNVALYNMLPPPGEASSFGFTVFGAPIHLLGSIRPGEYGLSAEAPDLLAKLPVLGVQLQLWGDPSDPSHDAARSGPVAPSGMPFITLPSACGALELSARTDSWENPGAFASRTVPIRSQSGEALEVEACDGLEFQPTLSIRPTTDAADNPAGLELSAEVPQRLSAEGSTTSSLQSATVTLPPGLVVNPSAARARDACSPTQIGLVSPVGDPHIRFDGTAAACPDASKLGTVEVLTPLLADEDEGVQSRHPLAGAVYLARPRQNPFGSLLALYAVFEDPERGIAVKLAGEVAADPVTGQLTAGFDEIPQLPLEEFKLAFFGGPRGAVRTPVLCGAYRSSGAMSPWAGTAPTNPESGFSIVTGASGGPCVDQADELPNAPQFSAGTVLPAAGRYSPFTLRLSRPDGSQEFGALNVTLPAGLVGRLVGSAPCPDAALVAAVARPGVQEVADPSCPAASRVGRVLAGLGAGVSPLLVEGAVYLAGPYRGAPLSLAVVVPAVAGPFDLGTVVLRAIVTVDPVSGQISVGSDPLPALLDGVPLDVRTVQVELDKSDLIRNPTSCQPETVSAEATSTLGQVAHVSSHFQVGDCRALPFKPRLSLRLSGALARNGHPTFRAVLRADPSGAALKSASFTFPGGELLDLRHVRGLCVQGRRADSCPESSRLGELRLESPLLDGPAEGSVYLVTPRHRLPELVAEVRSGPLRFVLRGRAIMRKGHFGVSFPSIPDIPLSRVVLVLAGGRQGLFVNSRSLCKGVGSAQASLGAHSGKRRQLRLRPRVSGC